MFADPAAATFRLEDDGGGMAWKELKQFHNLATSAKTRGAGIGFAGVGIKLALLATREVVTESRRGKSHAASRWHLASRELAPYVPIEPPGFVTEHGTAVLLQLTHGLSPLLDSGYLEHVIRQHFQPLLDESFSDALAPLYPNGVRFAIDGRPLEARRDRAPEHAPLAVRIGRQRKPSGLGHIERHALPLPEPQRGIAISTYGKVIRRGWDWLGLQPSAPDRITGIVEVPALAESLTLNKGDFVRTGPRGALYLAYRRAIQEAVQAELTRWGDARDPAHDERRRVARPLERDLERVLEGLTDAFPLLASLVERQRGGQRRIALGGGDRGAAGHAVAVAGAREGAIALAGGREGGDVSATAAAVDECDGGVTAPTPNVPRLSPPDPHDDSPPSDGVAPEADGGGGAGSRLARAQRYGLSVQFEPRPGDAELARLIENAVWINTEHPAYKRADATRSIPYHVAVAVALALAPLATGGSGVQGFVTAFLAEWGEAVAVQKRARRRVR
jgi:hypothetical protein